MFSPSVSTITILSTPFSLSGRPSLKGAPPASLLGAGVFGGLAMGASAWLQGKVAAAASDALAETGQGTANYFMAVGIVETVALFTLAFILRAV